MKNNELFKHAKFVKQIKSEKTGKWSFKVFIPYKKDFKSMTYTKTFNETNYLNPRQAYLEAIVCRDQFLLTQKTIGAPNYSNLTVNDTLEKYFLMTNLSHETIRKKRLTFSKWVNKELLEKNIRDVSAADIQFSLANASRQEKSSISISPFPFWSIVFTIFFSVLSKVFLTVILTVFATSFVAFLTPSVNRLKSGFSFVVIISLFSQG